MFIRLLYILFCFTLCSSQNFSYSEDDWFIITSPNEITSISKSYDEILFSSTNGIFAYDRLTDDFYFKHYLISDYLNDKMLVIHYDKFRDHIWTLTDKVLIFKSSISSTWREINFYDIELHSSNNIYNIGSNQDYIILESNTEYILIDPYTGSLVEDGNTISMIQFDQINWSSSYRSSNNNSTDLSSFFSLDDWSIINARQLENRTRKLNVLTVFDDNDENLWLGTDVGEIFVANKYSKVLKKIDAVPSNSNIKFSYIDNYGEWWIADNDWLYSNDKFVYEQEIIFLSRWNEVDNQWSLYYQNSYPHIQSKDINGIYRLNETLYVATNFGLLVCDLLDKSWKLFNKLNGLEDRVIDMVYYNNNLLLATDKGVFTFSTIIDKPVANDNFYFLNTFIYDLALKDDELYILSNFGFYKINLINNYYNKISDKIFNKIAINNNKIIVSINDFILEYNKNSLNKIFRLNNVQNFDICGNYIWAHNKKKAVIYNLIDNNRFEYDSYDGIVGDVINNLECDEDWVWFITNNGLVFYNWSNYHYEN